MQTLILSGDLTGKVLVPIIKQKNGDFRSSYFGQTWNLKTEDEIKDFERKLENAGAYSLRCGPELVEELKLDEKKVEETMRGLMIERIKDWLNLLLAKVDTKKIQTIVMPGNDDDLAIDKAIQAFETQGIIYPLDKVVMIEDYEMVSLDYVTPTPWDTPRETDERGLKRMAEEKILKIKDMKKAIFNFHDPPINTKIDLAPKLGKDMRLIAGLDGVKFVHVGSKAIREVIEKYQPLLGLHGHIHESSGFEYIGKTLCLNPGSEYGEGLLRGYIIELKDGKVENYWKIQG